MWVIFHFLPLIYSQSVHQSLAVLICSFAIHLWCDLCWIYISYWNISKMDIYVFLMGLFLFEEFVLLLLSIEVFDTFFMIVMQFLLIFWKLVSIYSRGSSCINFLSSIAAKIQIYQHEMDQNRKKQLTEQMKFQRIIVKDYQNEKTKYMLQMHKAQFDEVKRFKRRYEPSHNRVFHGNFLGNNLRNNQMAELDVNVSINPFPFNLPSQKRQNKMYNKGIKKSHFSKSTGCPFELFTIQEQSSIPEPSLSKSSFMPTSSRESSKNRNFKNSFHVKHIPKSKYKYKHCTHNSSNIQGMSFTNDITTKKNFNNRNYNMSVNKKDYNYIDECDNTKINVNTSNITNTNSNPNPNSNFWMKNIITNEMDQGNEVSDMYTVEDIINELSTRDIRKVISIVGKYALIKYQSSVVSKIANKRRAKKTQAPYKRYVYRSDFVDANSSEEEDNEDNSLGKSGNDTKDIYGNTKQSFRAGAHFTTTYILTSGEQKYTKIWPQSQFEKVDVLSHALNNIRKVELTLEDAEEDEEEPNDTNNLNNFASFTDLPFEIISQIFEILHARGKLRPRYLRVNKMFYEIVFPIIYREPYLKATNFFQFVDTISAKRTTGEYIQSLDLSRVIQSGKNAFVSKLLGRSKKSLRKFVAPQTSFGYAPLLSLKHCTKLQVLDLSLVSESLNLGELFKSIKMLQELTHLSFPRSSVSVDDDFHVNLQWPPRLSYLRLSGGISDEFLMSTNFPKTITHLEFAHCPVIKEEAFEVVLGRIGNNLKSLKVQYPMPRFKQNSMDCVFSYCPNLLVLEITVDYVSSEFFDENVLMYSDKPRPLKSLYIGSSGMMGTSSVLDPIDIAVALDDERLPNLKFIQYSAKLGWDDQSDYFQHLASEMEDRGGGLYMGY